MYKNITLVVLTILWSSSLVVGQNIPNAGFENWAVQGPFEMPADWIWIPSVSKSTDAHSGSFAAEATAADFVNPQSGDTIPLPGRIATGAQGGMGSPGIDGYAFTNTPDSLTGWFKYNPNGIDTCIFRVSLTSWNGSSQDLIAEAVYMNSAAVNSYQRFSIPLQYFSGATPDSCTIVCLSSNPQAGIQGSTLLVDDFSFVTVVGLEEANALPKTLVRIVDQMGRETVPQKNRVLIYVYSDGTTERVFEFK